MTDFISHEIVRMERGETKNSKSPMWRCETRDGQRVNIFSHADPAKDNTAIFRESGYLDDMEALKVGEVLNWTQHPIRVAMEKVGDWWTVKGVVQRPVDAEPDAAWKPNLALFRERAQKQAVNILGLSMLRVLDLETTGLRADDEICAIAILDGQGETLIDVLVKPSDPFKLLRPGKRGQTASEINGLTPDDFGSTPPFIDQYPKIANALDCAHWLIYNAQFDAPLLDRECSNAGVRPLIPLGIFDVARIASEYMGNWNEKRQWFEMVTLEEAAIDLAGSAGRLHAAADDAQSALLIMQAIARGVTPGDSSDVPF